MAPGSARGDDRYVRWCAPGFEDAFTALESALAQTAWPGPPPGFTVVGTPRRMRIVFRGVMAASAGELPVILKWSRPDRVGDRVSRQVRGGKGVRECRVLRGLHAAGIPAPHALACSDEGTDLLVSTEVADLRPLPPADAAPPALLTSVAGLVAAAHAAGLRHGDLHAGNLGLVGGAPLFIDLGSARLGSSLPEPARVRALAQLRESLLSDARRTQRLRALRAYLHAAGDQDPRGSARALASGIEARALVVRRRFRRGRDRRATRTGRHFLTFRRPPALTGIRDRRRTDAAWEERAAQWITRWPEEARALKQGARVVQVAHEGSVLALKRYAPAATGRVPRAERAFRRAFALQVRGVPVPRPMLAATNRDGGIYAAAFVEGPTLLSFLDPQGPFSAVAPGAQRRFLQDVGRTLRALHDAEVSNRDLKPPNLLVRPRDGDSSRWDLVLVDLDGVRIRRRPIPWQRRARDLARLDAGLDARAADRLRVLQAYWDVPPRPPVGRREFLGWVADAVRRKRGPAGLPR